MSMLKNVVAGDEDEFLGYWLFFEFLSYELLIVNMLELIGKDKVLQLFKKLFIYKIFDKVR